MTNISEVLKWTIKVQRSKEEFCVYCVLPKSKGLSACLHQFFQGLYKCLYDKSRPAYN